MGALSWCLRRVGIPWPALEAWLGVSLAIVFVLEVGFWRQRRRKQASRYLFDLFQPASGAAPQAERTAFGLERIRFETEHDRRETAQELIGVLFLLASAFGLALAVRANPVPPGGTGPVVVHLSDRIEKDIASYLENPPWAGDHRAPGETTVRLSPELEKALASYFNKPLGSGRGMSWITVVLIAIGAGLLIWAIARRPAAAPVIGAAELATLVIENAEHLSRPGGTDFWWFEYGLLLIGFLALLAGAIQLYRTDKSEQENSQEAKRAVDSKDDGAETAISAPAPSWIPDWNSIKAFLARSKASSEESLLTIGFSVLTLAWAILFVAHQPAAYPQAESPRQQSKVSEPVLLPAPEFEERKWVKPTGVPALLDALGKPEAKQGGMLLLLGSADCTRWKSPQDRLDNQTLALKRADEVSGFLQDAGFGKSGGLQILTKALPQYAGCKGKADLRAVYPFLIRTDNVGR